MNSSASPSDWEIPTEKSETVTPVLPGSVVGVLGGGQLGRMFALAARRMGYRVHSFSPGSGSPAGQIADVEISAPYEDLEAVRRFARAVQVVTFEFENVPVEAIRAAAASTPVRPGGWVLHTTQNRLREKRFLEKNGFPVAGFREVSGIPSLLEAVRDLGLPAVLKSAGFGYDGKGQSRIASEEDADAALVAAGAGEKILEEFIDFASEVSVVLSRDATGNCADWGVVENIHRNHILDVSLAPARVPDHVAAQATGLAREIANALGVVGTMCVEFFVTRADELLVNEIAPRPHNSGHWTIDASVTCQFEQQLRAVCGLALGSTGIKAPAAMANLLGDLWSGGEPDWAAACAEPEVKLHLYGKMEARPGRKMGHLTATAATVDESQELVLAARRRLCPLPE